MKKVFTFALAGLFVVFTSCSGNGTTNSAASGNSQGDKNIAANNAINDAITSGDVSKLDQYIATDGVDHGGDNGDIKGLDSIKANLKRLHDDYKDLKLEPLQVAATGDYVLAVTRFTGTSVVASMGAPAGTKFDMTSVDVTKFNNDGKAVEHWIYMQPADMMKMMAGSNMKMDQPMDKMKMDTSKHK